MKALKAAVLHLLYRQTLVDDPSIVRLAQRHHEAVSSELESPISEFDAEGLHADLCQKLHDLGVSDLPNGLAEIGGTSTPVVHMSTTSDGISE